MPEALAVDLSQEEPDTGAYAIYVTRLALVREVGKRRKKIELRNDFLRKFFWRPHWEEEVSSAVLGLDQKMASAHETGGLKDVAEVWDNARKYRHEASTSVEILERATPADPEQGPSAAQIHADKEILAKMAEYLLAVDQLDHLDRRSFKPHLRNGLATKARTKRIEEIAQEFKSWSEAEVIQLWALARGSERERLKFWDREIEDTQMSPLSIDAQDYLNRVTSQKLTVADEAEFFESFSYDSDDKIE